MEPPITTVISGVTLAGPGGTPLRSQLLSRTGICGVLRFVQGGCSTAPGDVALSQRSARELGVSMGAAINAGVIGNGASLPLRVTGIYAVPNLTLPYWWGGGLGYFGYGHVENHAPELDSFVTSIDTALAVPAQDCPQWRARSRSRRPRSASADRAISSERSRPPTRRWPPKGSC